MKTSLLATLLFILLFPATLRAQQQIELPCPSGYSVMPQVGTTFNSLTQKYRDWLCYDPFGNVNISGTATGLPASPANSVQYNNAGAFGGLGPVAAGSVLASAGTGVPPAFQLKGFIDVRDLGIDCTGIVDATAALNSMISGAANYSKFYFPEGCNPLVSTTAGNPQAITIQSKTGLEFWFEGRDVNGCSVSHAGLHDNSSYVSGATIFYINQSQGLLFHNMTLILNGAVDIGFDVDQTISPPITTDNLWENTCIGNNASRNGNFKGWRFSNTSISNVENQKLVKTYVQCSNQGIAGQTYGNSGVGIAFSGLNSNQKTEVVDGLNTFGCSSDEAMGTGSDFTALNFMMSQSFSNVTDGAFNSLVMGMRSEQATHAINVTNPTGPHTYIHNDFASSNGAPLDCTQGSTTGCGFIIGLGNETDAARDYLNAAPNGQNTAAFMVGNRNLGVTNQFEFQGGVWQLPFGIPGFNPVFTTFGEWFSPNVAPAQITENMQSPYIIFENAFGATPTFERYIAQNVPDGSYGAITNSTFVLGPVNVATTIGGFSNWPGNAITHWFSFWGNNSGINLAQAPTPNAPILNFIGTGGTSCYTYVIVTHGNNGTSAASAPQQSCVGPLTLSGSGKFRVAITSSPGATYYDVYRTQCGGTGAPCGTGAATGIIGQLAAGIYVNSLQSSAGNITLDDTGLSGDGTVAPTVNTSGDLTMASKGEHVSVASQGDTAGTCTAAAAATCTVTFTRAYNSAPVCTATDTTNITTLKVTPSTTTLVITTAAATSDVFDYICMGNPN